MCWFCCCCWACCWVIACKKDCCWVNIAWNWTALVSSSFFLIFSSSSRNALSDSAFSCINWRASLLLLLDFLSFGSWPSSDFRFFVCPILSKAWFLISSAVAFSWPFFSLASAIASLSLSAMSSRSTSSSSCSGTEIPDAANSVCSFSLNLPWIRLNLSLTARWDKLDLNLTVWHPLRFFAISSHRRPASFVPFLCL